MKIYGIEDEATAIQLAQLMKLNSECVKLQWSRTIKNIPQTVKNALEIIESFVCFKNISTVKKFSWFRSCISWRTSDRSEEKYKCFKSS